MIQKERKDKLGRQLHEEDPGNSGTLGKWGAGYTERMALKI